MAGIRQPTLEQPLAMVPANIPAPAGDDEERERIKITDVLKTCGVALTAGNFAAADAALEKLFYLGSPVGRPLQRVAAAFVYALASRVHKFSPLPPPVEVHAARHEFVATCPLLGFIAATAANKAILQAMEGERSVHVVDLGGANTTQWLELIRLFSARPGVAPRLRFTVVSDDDAFLINAGSVFAREAFRLQVPFLFKPVSTNIDRFSTADVAALGVERGEALAITSTLQLHRLIADVTTIDLPVPDDAAHGKKGKNKAAARPSQQIITMADALLRVLYDLEPKVMVLTEQEADHNASNLQDRICNSFDYYAELFSDLEAGAQSSVAARRAAVEKLLREEIVDIVSRDGASRRERHEKRVRWMARMRESGFVPKQVRFNVYRDLAWLVQLLLSGDGNRRQYRVGMDYGCFYFYSRMTLIFSVSVWHPGKNLVVAGK